MHREVLLIRHAQAHCNTTGIIAAHTCTGLTPAGIDQARHLARRLCAEQAAGQPVAQLYTSPIRRARHTARILGDATGTEPVLCADLRVPDPGAADGISWESARLRWPPDPDRPSRPLPPEAESWRAYLTRAHACLYGILAGHPGGRVAVIGHSETITATLTLLLGTPTLGALKVDLHPTGITRLEAAQERPHVPITTQRWTLTTHNDTAHLPAPN